jgi:hypothetical protein
MENKKIPQNTKEVDELYKAGELTAAEANEYLKKFGAGYFFDPATATDEKKQREDQEGFFNPEDRGLKRKQMPVLKRPDMSRRPDLAGKVIRQFTKAGTYDVHYDKFGSAVNAERVK